MEEEKAINFKQEAADVYYENFKDLPDDIKKRLSCYMLVEIFKVMVVPTIDHVRFVDRFGFSNRTQSPSIEEIMNDISKPQLNEEP